MVYLFLEQQAVNSPIYGSHISCLLFKVLLKSAVLLSAWMSNSHSSVNLMSCRLWKELRLCVCILRDCGNELEKEVGREEAPNFSWSFTS